MQKALPIGQYASIPFSAVVFDFSSPIIKGTSKKTSFGCSATRPSNGNFLINASTVLGAKNLINSPFASPKPSNLNVIDILEMLSVVDFASISYYSGNLNKWFCQFKRDSECSTLKA
jgi:hypothetical protein